jgi:YtkA-like
LKRQHSLGATLKRQHVLGATLALFAGVASAGVGCGSSGSEGGGAPDFSGAPVAVLTTNEGSFRLEIRTELEQPPARGSNTLELRITEVSSAAPADALDIVVVPWMPVMGHGASVTPTVKHGDAPGSYVVVGVNLFMPGTWELRTTLARGTTVEHATRSFQIP